MSSFTAIIMSRNEALHIRRAITSVNEAGGRVFLVDSGSTDDTVSIASSLGATVVTRQWTDHSDQFSWAMSHCPIQSPWYCRLDSDEYFCEDLILELRDIFLRMPSSIAGLSVKRRVHFLGRWIRHGGVYPQWTVRFWREGHASIEQVMDEHLLITGGSVMDLCGDIVDENIKGLRFWTSKHLDYAAREASGAVAQNFGDLDRLDKRAKAVRRKKKGMYYRLPPFWRVVAYWGYRYILRLGFLDGWQGFVYHLLQALWYRTMVDVIIVSKTQGQPRNDTSLSAHNHIHSF